MLRRTLAAVLAAAALVCPAGAQEAYLIGVTGANVEERLESTSRLTFS